MNLWQQIPVARAFAPFLAGILAAVYLLPPAIPFVLAGLGLLLALTLLLRLRWPHVRKVPAVLLGLAFFGFGWLATNLNTDHLRPHFIGHHIEQAELALVRLTEPPEATEKTWGAEVEVLQLMDSSSTEQPVEGNALIYFAKGGAPPPQYGDVVLVPARFRELEGPKNPGEFDYRQYMIFNQVYFNTYVPEGEWQLVGKDPNPLLEAVHGTRQQMLAWLAEYITTEEELAVASALLLGEKNRLTDELRQDYAASGAMHVLAVSGLHVGIFYLVFSLLLSGLTRIRHGELLRALILIVLLWGYALLTGLSPSVTRAATMFTFVAIGQNLSRSTNVYSSIITSAFLLLLINPYLIMQVGFQLSYAAVLGIVLLQPRIYNLIPLPGQMGRSGVAVKAPRDLPAWLLEKVWAITCVSIAAQIATFPIALLYFNQFPVYFLVSNLIVIPAAFILLWLGFPFLMLKAIAFGWLAFLEPVAALLGELLHQIILWLNMLISRINDIPFSLVTGLYVSILDTLWIYLIFVLFTASLAVRESRYLLACFALLILWVGKEGVEKWQFRQERELVLYSIRGETAINYIRGQEALLLAEPGLAEDEHRLKFHMQRYLWSRGIAGDALQPVSMAGGTSQLQPETSVQVRPPFYRVGGKDLVIVQEPLPEPPPQPLQVDYVLIRNGPWLDFELLTQHFAFQRLFFDPTNPPWKREAWRKECEELGLEYHDLAEEGAVRIEL